MTDYLLIKGLSVSTHIGVHAWEQRILQRVLIDLTLPVDFKACDDTLSNTLDYDSICQLVSAYVESSRFQLIESLANAVALRVKEAFNVSEVTLSVSKPHAIKNAQMVTVCATR